MKHPRCLIPTICCLAFSIFISTGCGQRAIAVNVDAAQTALTTMMESWKEGRTPEDLLDDSPAIIVQETEWNDNTKLLDYELLKDDREAGQNLIARVKLKLGQADGRVVEKTATYVVGTNPKLCVYRNLMK